MSWEVDFLVKHDTHLASGHETLLVADRLYRLFERSDCSRRLLTAEFWFRSEANSCGICDAKCGISLQILRFIPFSTIPSTLHTRTSQMLPTRSKWQLQ